MREIYMILWRSRDQDFRTSVLEWTPHFYEGTFAGACEYARAKVPSPEADVSGVVHVGQIAGAVDHLIDSAVVDFAMRRGAPKGQPFGVLLDGV
jgi:hypothetical protein